MESTPSTSTAATATTFSLKFTPLCVGITSVFCLLSSAKDGVFLLGQTVQNELCPFKVDVTIFSEIPPHEGYIIAPNCNESIDSIFSNFKTRKMRQEIISHKEAHENPVINGPFQIKSERLIWNVKLRCQIFPKNRDMEPDERLQRRCTVLLIMFSILYLCLTCTFSCFMSSLATHATGAGLGVLGKHIFS